MWYMVMLFSFSLPLSLLVSLPLSFLLFFFLLFTTATATASISPITVNFCSWLIRCNRSLIKGPLPIEGKSTVQALCFESQTNRYYSISAFPIFYLSCRHGNQTGMRPSLLSHILFHSISLPILHQFLTHPSTEPNNPSLYSSSQ